MGFVEVKPARANDEHGGIVAHAVAFAGRGIIEGERAAPAIDEVGLAVDQRIERRRGGILEIGHEHARARIERIDDHLGVGRAGDFDAAVGKVGGRGRDAPVGGANSGSFGEEIGHFAGIEPRLAQDAQREQHAARAIEATMKRGEEAQGLLAQHLPRPGMARRRNVGPTFGDCRLAHALRSTVM